MLLSRRWVAAIVLTTAFLGMGIAMPSCPGQQAMQQQIDQLTTGQQDHAKRLTTLIAQTKELNTDMGTIKQLLPQMTNVIQQQRTEISNLDAQVKDLQAKFAALSTKGSPKGKKRK
ncbi:MAG: hypothetical protein ACXWOH_07785 [Bdellovibrionota bacterium]